MYGSSDVSSTLKRRSTSRVSPAQVVPLPDTARRLDAASSWPNVSRSPSTMKSVTSLPIPSSATNKSLIVPWTLYCGRSKVPLPPGGELDDAGQRNRRSFHQVQCLDGDVSAFEIERIRCRSRRSEADPVPWPAPFPTRMLSSRTRSPSSSTSAIAVSKRLAVGDTLADGHRPFAERALVLARDEELVRTACRRGRSPRCRTRA